MLECVDCEKRFHAKMLLRIETGSRDWYCTNCWADAACAVVPFSMVIEQFSASIVSFGFTMNAYSFRRLIMKMYCHLVAHGFVQKVNFETIWTLFF